MTGWCCRRAERGFQIGCALHNIISLVLLGTESKRRCMNFPKPHSRHIQQEKPPPPEHFWDPEKGALRLV